MAQEVLKKLEEHLNCSICLDTYTDPKLLQCHHVFCRQCLVPLVARDQQGHLGLTCPTCRHVTSVTDRGVAGLQSAFQISHLLEIQDSLRKLNPAPAPEVAMGGASSKDVIKYCFEHPEDEVKLYCETCGELVCYECCLKGGKHCSHIYKKLNQAFQEYKKEIELSLEPMEKHVVSIKGALAKLDLRCKEIFNQESDTIDKIHITFRQLREVLNVRETELISQLYKVIQNKIKGLAAQKDQIQTKLVQLNSCIHLMKDSFKVGNEGDALMMKANTVKLVKELATPFQPDILLPNTEADILFSTLPDVTAMCQKYGEIIAQGSLDPSKCYITGMHDAGTVGKKSIAILNAVNFNNKPCVEQLIDSIECELVSEILGTRTKCSVEIRGQSQLILDRLSPHHQGETSTTHQS